MSEKLGKESQAFKQRSAESEDRIAFNQAHSGVNVDPRDYSSEESYLKALKAAREQAENDDYSDMQAYLESRPESLEAVTDFTDDMIAEKRAKLDAALFEDMLGKSERLKDANDLKKAFVEAKMVAAMKLESIEDVVDVSNEAEVQKHMDVVESIKQREDSIHGLLESFLTSEAASHLSEREKEMLAYAVIDATEPSEGTTGADIESVSKSGETEEDPMVSPAETPEPEVTTHEVETAEADPSKEPAPSAKAETTDTTTGGSPEGAHDGGEEAHEPTPEKQERKPKYKEKEPVLYINVAGVAESGWYIEDVVQGDDGAVYYNIAKSNPGDPAGEASIRLNSIPEDMIRRDDTAAAKIPEPEAPASSEEKSDAELSVDQKVQFIDPTNVPYDVTIIGIEDKPDGSRTYKIEHSNGHIEYATEDQLRVLPTTPEEKSDAEFSVGDGVIYTSRFGDKIHVKIKNFHVNDDGSRTYEIEYDDGYIQGSVKASELEAAPTTPENSTGEQQPALGGEGQEPDPVLEPVVPPNPEGIDDIVANMQSRPEANQASGERERKRNIIRGIGRLAVKQIIKVKDYLIGWGKDIKKAGKESLQMWKEKGTRLRDRANEADEPPARPESQPDQGGDDAPDESDESKEDDRGLLPPESLRDGLLNFQASFAMESQSDPSLTHERWKKIIYDFLKTTDGQTVLYRDPASLKWVSGPLDMEKISADSDILETVWLTQEQAQAINKLNIDYNKTLGTV